MSATPLRPDWTCALDRRPDVVRFDARPWLARGEEPFDAIMDLAAAVPVGGGLIVEAPFDPGPLRRILTGQGFAAHAEAVGPGHWRTWFRRQRRTDTDEAASTQPARIWRAADAVHIDVRGLEPPGPMLAILELLESEGCTPAVIVHHDREPLFLYPELAERGWTWNIVPGNPGEVRLKLEKERP